MPMGTVKKAEVSAAEVNNPGSNHNSSSEQSIAARFGCVPNFFRLTATRDPEIAANLWGFAQFAYLDNPLPSLFKERLSFTCRAFAKYDIASPGTSAFWSD